MKKNKHELDRVQTILESERFSVGEQYIELVERDLIRLFSDYFDFKCNPTLEIVPVGNNYVVSVKLNAIGIKTFGALPR